MLFRSVSSPVDMTGIPANVHAIQWYGLRNSGNIEYKVDPETGLLPAPETFTDSGIYYKQTQAAQNPLILYSTYDGASYNGESYMEGDQVVVHTWPHPPTPVGFTTTVTLGGLGPQQYWQWNGTQWVASTFPIEYNLAKAKTALTSLVKINAKTIVNVQAKIGRAHV